MTDYLSDAVDTFVLSTEPSLAHNGLTYLEVGVGKAYSYVWHATMDLPTDTTLTGKLRLSAVGAWGASPVTVVVTPVSAPWSSSEATWNNQPAVTGTPISLTKVSNADGDVWEFNVSVPITAAVGLDVNYGFRVEITTAGPNLRFYSSRSPVFEPILAVDYVIPASRPTNLSPAGGRIVATQKPCLEWQASSVSKVQVQVTKNLSGDFTDIPNLYDSGVVPGVVMPEYDLASTGYVPPSGGLLAQLVTWRCQYWDAAGNPSGWSDPQQYAYRVYPDVGLTLPDSSGLVFDTEVPLSWTYSSPDGSPQAIVHELLTTDADLTDTKHDSGRIPQTATTLTIPAGHIKDPTKMKVRLRVTDSFTREAVRGFPTYKEVSQTFQFQATSTVPPPDSLFVYQVYTSSFNMLVWTRGHTPDKWGIIRDDEVIARLDPSEVIVNDQGEFTWIDFGAQGGASQEYRVAAIVDHKLSAGGPKVTMLNYPRGVHIGVPSTQTVIKLQGQDQGSWTMGEAAAVYMPMHSGDAVRVVQGQRGYEGNFTGTLRDDQVDTARKKYVNLMKLRETPSTQVVLSFPQFSFYAILGNISAAPNPAPYPIFDASFDFWQQGDLLSLSLQRPSQTPTLVVNDDYEDGVDNTAVVVTGPRVLINGNPLFLKAAALHGKMGWRQPDAAGGGVVFYDLPNQVAGTIDFYSRVNSYSTGPIYLMAFMGGFGGIQISTAGAYTLVNQDGTVVGSSKTVVARWKTLDKTRLVVFYTWNAALSGMDVLASFYQGPADSAAPIEVLGGFIAMPSAPARVRLGSGTPGAQVDFDDARLFVGNAAAPDPVAPAPDAANHVYSTTGDPSLGSVWVTSLVKGYTGKLKVGWSMTADSSGYPSGTVTYGPDMTGQYGGYFGCQLTLLPNTNATYYCALYDTVTGFVVGTPFKARTTPSLTPNSFTLKVVNISCQCNGVNGDPQTAWADALAWGPDLCIPQGDDGYFGATLDPADPKYAVKPGNDPLQAHLDTIETQMKRVPKARDFYSQITQIGRSVSDHEMAGNNDELTAAASNTPVWPSTDYNLKARPIAWAMGNSSDTSVPIKGHYRARVIGSRFKFIALDFRNSYRTPGHVADPMDGSKTMYGAAQLNWLFNNAFDSTRLNILCMESWWLTGNTITASSVDKPSAYPYERKLIGDWITSHGLKVMGICGDRHGLGYVTGADNPIGGFPCYLASGMQMKNLTYFKDEIYTASWGFNTGTPSEVRQFGKFTFIYTKGTPDTVSVDFSGYDSISHADVLTAPRATWTF